MDFLRHLPSEIPNHLYGHIRGAGRDPLWDDSYRNRGRSWPSPDGYEAYGYGYEQDYLALHQERARYHHRLDFQAPPSDDVFEGVKVGREELYDRTQPIDVAYAGDANSISFHFEPWHSFRRPNRSQYHHPTFGPDRHRPFYPPRSEHHDPWLSSDNILGHEQADHHDHMRGPWSKRDERMPAYTVEEPDENEVDDSTRLPHRPRPIEQDSMHYEQRPENYPSNGDDLAERAFATSFRWAPSPFHSAPRPPHSAPACPSPRIGSIRHPRSSSELRSHSPSERRPSPEDPPYERKATNEIANPFEPPALEVDSYNAMHLHRKLKRKHARLNRWGERLLRQARGLDLREIKIREQEVRLDSRIIGNMFPDW